MAPEVSQRRVVRALERVEAHGSLRNRRMALASNPHKSFFKNGFLLGLARGIGKNTQRHIDRPLF
jgi:hypothetical protein